MNKVPTKKGKWYKVDYINHLVKHDKIPAGVLWSYDIDMLYALYKQSKARLLKEKKEEEKANDNR